MDSTVTLWNPSLTLVKKLNLGASSATSLVQVGNYVYIADAKQIFVFDSQTYALIKAIDLPHMQYLLNTDAENTSSEKAVAQDQDHATQTLPSSIQINRSDTATPMSRAHRPSFASETFSGYFVRCMAHVERYVWVCTDGFVCFIDTHTVTVVPGTLISVPKVNSIVYVKSLQQVWGGCSDSSIYIWDSSAPEIRKGSVPAGIEPLKKLAGGSGDRVSSLANFEDKLIYSGSWDKMLRIWDAKEAKLMHTSQKLHGYPVMAIVLLPYPWLRVIPSKPQVHKMQGKKMEGGADSTSSNTTTVTSNSATPELRRGSHSLPGVMSPSSSSTTLSFPSLNTSLSSSSTQIPKDAQHTFESSSSASTNGGTSSPGLESSAEVEVVTIMTVYTADWSSVYMWA